MTAPSDFDLVPKEIEDRIKKHGLNESLYEDITESLDAWKNQKLHIAVVGDARQGKSSLVNALFNKDNLEDPEEKCRTNASRVQTKRVEAVEIPNVRVKIFDTPGITGGSHRREDWEKYIEWDKYKYDYFIIVTDNTFSDAVAHIAKLISNRWKRNFCVARSKVDKTIEDKQEELSSRAKKRRMGDTGEPHIHLDMTVKDIINDIRQDMRYQIDQCKGLINKDAVKVFLIDNKHPENTSLDFQKLAIAIFESLENDLQKEIFLNAVNKVINLVKYHKEVLKKRIGSASLLCYFNNWFNSKKKEALKFADEVALYLRRFGLMHKDIAQLELFKGKKAGDIESYLLRRLNTVPKSISLVREYEKSKLESNVGCEENEKRAENLVNYLLEKDLEPSDGEALINTIRPGSIAGAVVTASMNAAASYAGVSVDAGSLLTTLGFTASGALSFRKTNSALTQILDEIANIAEYVINLYLQTNTVPSFTSQSASTL